jgi:hypothetical protein
MCSTSRAAYPTAMADGACGAAIRGVCWFGAIRAWLGVRRGESRAEALSPRSGHKTIAPGASLGYKG